MSGRGSGQPARERLADVLTKGVNNETLHRWDGNAPSVACRRVECLCDSGLCPECAAFLADYLLAHGVTVRQPAADTLLSAVLGNAQMAALKDQGTWWGSDLAMALDAYYAELGQPEGEQERCRHCGKERYDIRHLRTLAGDENHLFEPEGEQDGGGTVGPKCVPVAPDTALAQRESPAVPAQGQPLLPCPFCGMTAIAKAQKSVRTFGVFCANDGCGCRVSGYASPEQAAHAWNRRAPPVRDALREAAKLRELLPQMREDVECHRSWTTVEAKADIEKVGAKLLGNVEWHERWAKYYGDVAEAMERAANLLATLAATEKGE